MYVDSGHSEAGVLRLFDNSVPSSRPLNLRLACGWTAVCLELLLVGISNKSTSKREAFRVRNRVVEADCSVRLSR
jgi:hypothetical protein